VEKPPRAVSKVWDCAEHTHHEEAADGLDFAEAKNLSAALWCENVGAKVGPVTTDERWGDEGRFVKGRLETEDER
jgi:hypothetical protein